MYKFYITLNTGDNKDVLVVDANNYNSILDAKKNSNDFVTIKTEENFKNGQRVIQRVINPDQIVSMNIVQIEQEEKDKNVITNPHQYFLHKNSLARKILVPDYIPSLDIPAIYYKDRKYGWSKNKNTNFDIQPYIASKEEKRFDYSIDPCEFSVPNFRINAQPSFKHEDYSERFLEVNNDEIKNCLTEKIMQQETTEVLKQLDFSTLRHPTKNIFNNEFDNLEEAIARLEARQCMAKNLIVSNFNRYYLQSIPGVKLYNIEDVDIFGKHGHYKNIDIHLSDVMAQDVMLLLAAPRYIGVMPIWGEPQCDIEPITHRNRTRMIMHEDIGICIANPKAVTIINL